MSSMRRHTLPRKTACLLLTAAALLLALPVDARGPGGGRGGGPRISQSGPASHGSVRHARSGRREAARDVRGERGEFARDLRHERHEWWEDRWRRQVGATLTATAFRSLACRPTVVVVESVAFYSCDGIWFNRRYVAGSVTYVVVTPPPGY